MKKLLWAALILFASSPAMAEVEGVVSSIKPIHSLVENVLGDSGKSALIVTGNQSPHGYHLRPSEVKKLSTARVVFYIDDDFETFLVKPLSNLDKNVVRVPLVKAAGIPLLEARTSGTWEAHIHAGEEDAKHDEHEENDEHHAHEDMHVWLAPENAIQMVGAIEKALSETYPAQAKTFHANAAHTIKKLNALDKKLRTTLKPVEGKPYIVFHDAFQYFEKAYGLTSVGSITLSPEQAPSAKRIKEVRAKVSGLKAVCVFSEAQFSKRLVDSVMEGSTAKSRVLDEHGPNIQPGKDLYFILLSRIAERMESCLK